MIFYLLSRNFVGGAFLQNFQSVTTRENAIADFLSGKTSQHLHRKFYSTTSPVYLLCPVSIIILVGIADGTDWWCRCDMVAHSQPSQLCAWHRMQHPLFFNHELVHFTLDLSANITIIFLKAFRNLILPYCSSLSVLHFVWVTSFPTLYNLIWPASWSSGQSLWLLIMRSRVRFPVLPWEFSLKGRIPAVTMVWVG